MVYKLRYYQSEAMRRIMQLIAMGVTSILAVAPTGAGKTVLAAAIIEYFISRGARVLFVAHRDDLIIQCCNKLKENGVRFGVIKSGRDAGDLSARVHVASVQTFIARLRFMLASYDLIIFDEAHHSVVPSYLKIIQHCTHDGHQPIVIGLTATPYRTDGRGLGDIYKEMVNVASVTELIDQGFLVPPRIFRAEAPRELHSLKLQGGDYREEDLERVMNKPRLLGHAVNEYLRIAGGMRCLGFFVNRAHAKNALEAFLAAGVPTEYVDGETAASAREAIWDRLYRGRTLYVANVGVATEGFDMPRLEAIQGARPTGSRNVWRQAIGRGARPCQEINKTHFLLLDHCGWTKNHGYFTDPDVVDLCRGLSKERPTTMTTCRACGAQLASRPRVCPACGVPLVSSQQEDTIGLGDASIQLSEDAPFFGGFQARPYLSRPATVYVPARPSQNRVIRRCRGL